MQVSSSFPSSLSLVPRVCYWQQGIVEVRESGFKEAAYYNLIPSCDNVLHLWCQEIKVTARHYLPSTRGIENGA